MKKNKSWPTLRNYDQAHLDRIALPIGGIGTGTVSIGGRGDLRDWEVGNVPAKGFSLVENSQPGAFFALWCRDHRGQEATRALEGNIPEHLYESAAGASVPNHSLPRFRNASFATAYPLGQVMLSDSDIPLDVRIEAFNPLVPGDAEISGLPIAILRYVLVNRTSRPLEASVCGSVPNVIGADGSPQDGHAALARDNRNDYRKTRHARAIYMHSQGLAPDSDQWGTMALATTASAGVTYRTAWAPERWGDSLLDFWDEFSCDGRLSDRYKGDNRNPHASLAVRLTVPARSEVPVTFLLAWHFPNRVSWNKPVAAKHGDGKPEENKGSKPDRIGNYYATRQHDAWRVIEQSVGKLPQYEKQTVDFVRAFCDSDLPEAVKEAALFNISTLRTQTTFRLPSGHLAGWEGCNDRSGSCAGSCAHVWNYENTTSALFGTLSRSMREVQFLHACDDNGLITFRVSLPLGREPQWPWAAADGQMGCIMHLYRDWQLSGDDAFLRKLWPRARKAMEFCWIPGGWDADQDGVMEGPQHNTMDVEYHGPNPQMTGWYLGALRATEEMARYLGEREFAEKCRDLFERGSHWMDSHLFNGEYYEHHIIPPKSPEAVAEGLVVHPDTKNLTKPDFQLGAGCLVDQLVGQYMAHVCGLGYLHDPRKVRKAMKAIMKYNFRTSLHGHFNHLRTFAFNDEAGLLMGSYPKGNRPKSPFPYCNELMTGFEYTAATGLLYEGETADGLRCIEAVRARYDGKKRNPFDEAECGHHYARAMAAWSTVLALTGFHYSAVTGCICFRRPQKKRTKWFFSTGESWGTLRITSSEANFMKVSLCVMHGKIKLTSFTITEFGTKKLPRVKTLREDQTLNIVIERVS